MNPTSKAKLRALLTQEEGYRQFAYQDTTGNLTIGIGHNLTANGISINAANYILDEDIDYFINKIKESVPVFDDLCEARQMVLVDMCFNLGLKGFLKFTRMLAYVCQEDYVSAAGEIEYSKAAMQTGERYKRLAQMMKAGGS